MAETETVKRIRGMQVVFSEAEIAAVLGRIEGALRRGWVMWGPEQEELQRRFAELTGRRHAVTFSSATAALEVVFRWLRRRGARTVAFQANNFPSPPMAALRAGLSLAWVDIDPRRLCPSLADLQAARAETRFEALALTWTGGFVSDEAAEIRRWCEREGITLVEDASHAAGARAGGRPAGSLGDVAVFSLAATKALHTAQGGMLVTDDPELAQTAFRMKNYGRTELFQRGRYVERDGMNAHMTELQAALGNALLDTVADRIAARARLARLYRPYLERCGLEALGCQGEGFEPNWYKCPVQLPSAEALGPLRAHLEARGVELGSAMYDFVTPALDVWGKLARPAEAFPRALDYSRRHTCLPMHNGLGPEDIERVGAGLLSFFA